jgi:deoxyribodipyrimidine photo-lyase
MKKPKAIHWFRQDLRLSDNPAFNDAAKNNSILPIYILDDKNSKEFSMGAASRFWLHHSLTCLDKSLDDNLSIYHGDPLEIIFEIIDRLNIE